jgi:hypothetical protein
MTDHEIDLTAQLEELKNKFNKFVDRTRRMRHWQKAFERYRVGSDKETMKRLQREIDNTILQLEKENVIEKVQLKIFS